MSSPMAGCVDRLSKKRKKTRKEEMPKHAWVRARAGGEGEGEVER